jgi:hypothetical protein
MGLLDDRLDGTEGVMGVSEVVNGLDAAAGVTGLSDVVVDSMGVLLFVRL